MATLHLSKECSTGEFYTSPSFRSRLDTSEPVTFSWDTSCYPNPPKWVDIHLLNPNGQPVEVHVFGKAKFKDGTFTTKIKPKWWNSAAEIDLQVAIVPSNTPLFLSIFPAGPIFTALYDFRATVALHPDADVSKPEPVYELVGKRSGLPSGRLAAAIVLPLLVVVMAVVGYVLYSRRQQATIRRRWLESVDKRMSVISGEWQTMSASLSGRPSFQTHRTPRPSFHRSKEMLAQNSPIREGWVTHSPPYRSPVRERAWSGADLNEKPLPIIIDDAVLAYQRTRSTPNSPESPRYPDTSSGRPMVATRLRTLSTASNNPYVHAMIQRDSMVVSENSPTRSGTFAFPSIANEDYYLARARVNSDARNSDAYQARSGSRVSFADVLANGHERRRRNNSTPLRNVSDDRNNNTGEDSVLDWDDAMPALAMMRTRSRDSRGDAGFDSSFIPRSYTQSGRWYSHTPGIEARTPDEMMKEYASANALNRRPSDSRAGVSSTLFDTMKRLPFFKWRQ